MFLSAGNGVPTPADGGGGGVGNAEEAGVIRPMSDAYDAALKAARIDVTYQTHEGCHCWPDFQAELRKRHRLGAVQAGRQAPQANWVNDTVATHGQLWDVGYRFGTHPNAVVRFIRAADRLRIGAGGTSVTLTIRGGCVLHVATPVSIRIPSRTCARPWRRRRRRGRSAARQARAVHRRGGFTGWEKEITHVTGAGEPELAVGASGRPLLVAFNSCGIAISHDRGNSFVVKHKNPADPGPTPGDPYHSCSDPVAAIGPRNVLYTGAGYWDQPAGDVDYYNMFVSHSTDRGLSWSKPAFATGDRTAPQELLLGRNTGHTDRLFLTVDASTGTVYGSATDLPRLVRWVVVSHDGGSSFGPPHAIDSNAYPQAQGEQAGDYIPDAANGVVAFAYAASAAPSHKCPCGIFETSRDGGVTWTRHFSPFIANWVAADASHPGRFAIMSGQGVTATPADPGYIAISTTSNYGGTWTKPVLVGQTPLHPRIQPWIAYSPTGVLGVGYKTLYTGLIS